MNTKNRPKNPYAEPPFGSIIEHFGAPLTPKQRKSRLPGRPWHIYVSQVEGDTAYVVISANDVEVATFDDHDYRAPGAARALAESLVTWANDEASGRRPGWRRLEGPVPHLRLLH